MIDIQENHLGKLLGEAFGKAELVRDSLLAHLKGGYDPDGKRLAHLVRELVEHPKTPLFDALAILQIAQRVQKEMVVLVESMQKKL